MRPHTTHCRWMYRGFATPTFFQKPPASERGSGWHILETSIENGFYDVAFLKKLLSQATQYRYRSIFGNPIGVTLTCVSTRIVIEAELVCGSSLSLVPSPGRGCPHHGAHHCLAPCASFVRRWRREGFIIHLCIAHIVSVHHMIEPSTSVFVRECGAFQTISGKSQHGCQTVCKELCMGVAFECRSHSRHCTCLWNPRQMESLQMPGRVRIDLACALVIDRPLAK
jgi:hypothetical protein